MKAAIEKAFLELVQECSFEKITVRKICTRAAVSKNSFYRNFHDKFDLAYSVIDRQIASRLESRKVGPHEKIPAFLGIIEENRPLYERLFSYGGPEPYIDHLQKKMLQDFLSCFPQDRRDGVYWQAQLLSWGIPLMIREWTEKGCQPGADILFEEIRPQLDALFSREKSGDFGL